MLFHSLRTPFHVAPLQRWPTNNLPTIIQGIILRTCITMGTLSNTLSHHHTTARMAIPRLTLPHEWQRDLPMAQGEDRILIAVTRHIIPISRSTTSISSMWMELLPAHHQPHPPMLTLILTNHNPHMLRIPITLFTRLMPTTFHGLQSHSLHCPNNSLGLITSLRTLPQPHNLAPQLMTPCMYLNPSLSPP